MPHILTIPIRQNTFFLEKESEIINFTSKMKEQNVNTVTINRINI